MRYTVVFAADEVNQPCVYMYPFSLWTSLPPTSTPPIPVIAEHPAELLVLYVNSRLPLAILHMFFYISIFYIAIRFTYGSIYMSILTSQFILPFPPSLSFPSCLQVQSLFLLYSCPGNRFQMYFLIVNRDKYN